MPSPEENSAREQELRARLLTGEVGKTIDWYIQVAIKQRLEWKDVSAFEARIWKMIERDFSEWRKARKLH